MYKSVGHLVEVRKLFIIEKKSWMECDGQTNGSAKRELPNSEFVFLMKNIFAFVFMDLNLLDILRSRATNL